MKKTYVTSMPDHIGAFLKASTCISHLGLNITRVNYNKAVDSHTLFIDVEGTEEQLKEADIALTEIGYLQNIHAKSSIILLEFYLKDEPGSAIGVLTLINDFHFNISYLSSQENGTDYQCFKMGLYVDDEEKVSRFLKEAKKLCKVRVVEYNSSEKVYDNSIFYSTYVAGLSQVIGLSEEFRNELMVHVNLAMQTLDEQGLSPYRTFDSISKFAELLGTSMGENFSPRISNHKITDNTEIILIEPPCGSNTTIIKSFDKVLFVDTGYACYEKEMLQIFHKIFPNFDTMEKTVLVTHGDLDHCGLLHLFDTVIAAPRTIETLEKEYLGQPIHREENPLHRPYINICKILTSYKPVDPKKLCPMWYRFPELVSPLTQIGFFEFGDLHFEVYEGKGGHVPGSIVLIDYNKHIAITGDIYINMHGLTAIQAQCNQYAPILMTSVDSDPHLCAEERRSILRRLGVGQWQIFGGHGFKKDYGVSV